jgi:hypothetical protein
MRFAGRPPLDERSLYERWVGGPQLWLIRHIGDFKFVCTLRNKAEQWPRDKLMGIGMT